MFFVFKKIRSANMQIESAVFWVLFMIGLVTISFFPGIVIYMSKIIGVESPANFVFLSIMFLLLLKVFSLSIQISKMQYQIHQLGQIIALKEKEAEQNLKNYKFNINRNHHGVKRKFILFF